MQWVRIAAVWLVLVHLLVTGCGRNWPAVAGVADPSFAVAPARGATVDLLPFDVDIAVAPRAGAGAGANSVAGRFFATSYAAVRAELAARGYAINAALGWDGTYARDDGAVAVALAPEAVSATAQSLAGYGYAQSQLPPGQLLTPYLPARLGGATGAATTLYVGGWAYVATKPGSTGKKVAIGLVVGVFAIVAVVAILAMAKDGGGSAGRAAGAAARGAGKAAVTVVRGAGRAASGAVRGAGRALGAAARGTGRLASAAVRTGAHGARLGLRAATELARVVAETSRDGADCFGRSHTHIELYGGDPTGYQREPPTQGTNRMYLEMTLVDNADGRTLWHARQTFEGANAASRSHVRRVVARMLASLPAPRAR